MIFSQINNFVINLLPLNLSETKVAIQIRRDLHEWRIPLAWENKVYRMSGGLLRLVKRISAYIDKNDNVEPSNLLKYAPITVILAQLAQTYSQLTPATLYKLGLTNKNGAIRSELLRMYIQRNTATPLKSDLSKSLKMVFDLLFENRNKIVSNEQIDMAVHGHAGNTLWANYKLVGRLKPHIKNRYRIRSIRGQGYMLTEV